VGELAIDAREDDLEGERDVIHEDEAGLMQSLPTGTPRMAAISRVTFTPGSTPPSPGLAPWLILISIARVGLPSMFASKVSSEKPPFESRAPKFIAEVLMIDPGRNACFRPRDPPSTFAEGIR
jgi:hypothetical protein